MTDLSTQPPPEQRQRILDAALALLGHDGAAGLTVRNVAAAAGCSTTGVYTYFGGKDGLIDAIFIEGFDSFDEALNLDDGDIHTAGWAYRQWALAHRTHYLVMFASAVPGYVPSPEAQDRATASFDALVHRVGATAAVPDEEARTLAVHLWATVHGYVMLEMLGMFPPALGPPDELFGNGLRRVFESPR